MWFKPFFPVYVALGAHCPAPSQLTTSFKKLLLVLPAILLLLLLLPLNTVSIAVSCHICYCYSHFAEHISALQDFFSLGGQLHQVWVTAQV